MLPLPSLLKVRRSKGTPASKACLTGKRGLEPVLEILETTELPISVFRPTHVNRNPMLYKQTIQFALQGGIIDLTCGMTGSAIPVPQAVKQALDAGVPLVTY